MNNSAWLFPGQGSQAIRMGSSMKGFESHLESAMDLAEEFSELDLRNCVARGPESTLTETQYAQPAIVALSVGLVDFLRDHGKRPDAVAGHSLGEFSALYAAGVLSIHDTLRLAAARGTLMAASAEGTMVAVKALSPETIQQRIDATGSATLVVANHNTPEQTVVSGDVASVEQFEAQLSESGHRFVRLNVSGAWHSPLVDDAAKQFERVLDGVEFSSPSCQLFLASVARRVDSAEEIRDIMNRQIVRPVLWRQTITAMFDAGLRDYIEVGPGKVLRGLMRKAAPADVDYSIRGAENRRFIQQVAAEATEGPVT